MLGYGFSHAGGPEVIDAIDLATPAPGPQEIQIKSQAIGLNNRDRIARQMGGSGLRCRVMMLLALSVLSAIR